MSVNSMTHMNNQITYQIAFVLQQGHQSILCAHVSPTVFGLD
jgi:hypothetical protein